MSEPESPEYNTEEFQDPLENYEPPIYSDSLEEALMEKPVSEIHAQPFTAVSPDTPVHEALETLVGHDIACTLVTENDRLVGIFSDRDVLDKVALEYDDVKDLPVRDVMTAKPIFVRDDDSPAATLCVMARSGYRHVPVVDIDDKVIGIVSPPRVMDFLQQFFQNNT